MAYQRGGRTDKAGNKYETNYFILQLLRVLVMQLAQLTIQLSGVILAGQTRHLQ